MPANAPSLQDIHPLTDFQRNTKRHIRRLKKTKRPEVLTVNGKAEVVVQDARSYQALIDQVDYWQSVASVKKGLAEVKRGEGVPLEAAFEQIRRKHRIPKRPV